MEWLSEWLREIILVVLLAIFIDLLLPSNKMQRYVKVVLSLFILMTILFPIIQLFQGDNVLINWQAEAVQSARMDPLSKLLSEGEALSVSNEQAAMKVVENQVADKIKQQLQQEMPNLIRDVEVTTRLDAASGLREIDGVKVTIRAVRDSPNSAASEEDQQDIAVMVPMAPIKVEIGLGDEQEMKQPGSADNQQAEKQIAQILQQNWQISPRQLLVIMED